MLVGIDLRAPRLRRLVQLLDALCHGGECLGGNRPGRLWNALLTHRRF
jgi:hypothetical protein